MCNARSGQTCTEKSTRTKQIRDSTRGTLFGQSIREPLRHFIGRYPFPARLNEHHLRRLRASNRAKPFAKGAILFREGELPREVHIILRGCVKKSISSSEGRTLVIGFFGPGRVVGLEANILGRPYAATAEAAQEIEALVVPRHDLIAEIQSNSTAGWQVSQLLSENSYFLMGKLEATDLSESAIQMVARCLLELSAQSAFRSEQAVFSDLSQEAIAQMIGISRETVNRHLSQFRRAGMLQWTRSHFVIRDRGALEKFAKLPCAAA